MDMEFPSTKSWSLIVEAWSTQCRNFQPALFPGGINQGIDLGVLGSVWVYLSERVVPIIGGLRCIGCLIGTMVQLCATGITYFAFI